VPLPVEALQSTHCST